MRDYFLAAQFIFKIRRCHLILAVSLLLLLSALGTFSRESSPLRHTPEMPKAMQSVFPTLVPKDLEAKEIALTFDDGPHLYYTERLLEILHEYSVPATFFLVGKQVELYPQLVQKIFIEGHELANHTYSHRDLRSLSFKEFQNELEKTHQLVESITHQRMRFFRPPGGQYNREVVQRAKNLGYTMVLWTIFPQDHSNPSSDLIQNRVLSTAQKNGIVLLHSGIENTLSILPELIVTLRKQGYSFVTLSQCLKNAQLRS